MRIVFSRDRPAQLDLLLRSLARYAPPEPTTVIYRATAVPFVAGYANTEHDHPDVSWQMEAHPDDFDRLLRLALAVDETVMFLCDDDVLYRRVGREPSAVLADPDVLTFSLRLGVTGAIRPVHTRVHDGVAYWDWPALDPHDHGYPGSVDGHTFRTEDVHAMVGAWRCANPLELETALARRAGNLAASRPLMACYPDQRLVGIPANSVTDAGGRRPTNGMASEKAEALNSRYLAGERISLDALDLDGVDGCLVSQRFEWVAA